MDAGLWEWSQWDNEILLDLMKGNEFLLDLTNGTFS